MNNSSSVKPYTVFRRGKSATEPDIWDGFWGFLRSTQQSRNRKLPVSITWTGVLFTFSCWKERSDAKRKAPRLVRKGRFPNRFAFRSKLRVLERPKNQRNWGAPKILNWIKFCTLIHIPQGHSGTPRNCKKRGWLISSKNITSIFSNIVWLHAY
jgi:hypothetical protein